MRVHVVSDVHGSVEALSRAGDGADVLVCLGDLVLFLDYAEPANGIFAELFGAAAAERLIALRTAKEFEAARNFSRSLWQSSWESLGEDSRAVMTRMLRQQYADLFPVMHDPTYLTYGNVDVPSLWPEFLGGLQTPMRTPHEISDEEFAAKVAAVGAVDVLACHIPPNIPELLYDVAARRFERGSGATLDAIRDTQPALALFGHVHQPLQSRIRIGRTECVNVGHFQGTGSPYVLDY